MPKSRDPATPGAPGGVPTFEERATITKRQVDALQPRETIVDDEVRGFVARYLKSGSVAYGLRFSTGGKQKWLSLGLHGRLTPDKARALAKQRAGEIAAGRDPLAEQASKRTSGTTVDAVLDPRAHNLRAAGDVERILDRYLRPRIGSKPIAELRRRHVIKLLHAIEDGAAAVMADRTLAWLRKALNWHATRDDTFVPPIIRGMARTKPADRARTRVLDDEEVRDVWQALDAAPVPACFPTFVRALILTAQAAR